MSVKEQYWKYSLITIILGLGLILFIKMSPFMGGILGAVPCKFTHLIFM